MSVTNNGALVAFLALGKVAEARANKLTKYARPPAFEETNKMSDSNWPIMNKLIHSNGALSIMKLTNFTLKKIQRLMQ